MSRLVTAPNRAREYETIYILRPDIDADSAEHSKIIRADYTAHGDLRLVLEQVLDCLEDRKMKKDYSAWWASIEEWKKDRPLPYVKKESRGEPGNISADQFAAMNKAEFERFGKLIKTANIKAE